MQGGVPSGPGNRPRWSPQTGPKWKGREGPGELESRSWAQERLVRAPGESWSLLPAASVGLPQHLLAALPQPWGRPLPQGLLSALPQLWSCEAPTVLLSPGLPETLLRCP